VRGVRLERIRAVFMGGEVLTVASSSSSSLFRGPRVRILFQKKVRASFLINPLSLTHVHGERGGGGAFIVGGKEDLLIRDLTALHKAVLYEW
jgi:hypothetical protein